MRIRSTKPEFIASLPLSERLAIAEHLPRLVFSGPIGNVKAWREMDRMDGFIRWSHACFIYHLFDGAGDPIYIGKALTASYRFQSHSRKPWWSEVRHLNLYIVSCESHKHDPCRDWGADPRKWMERMALLWERKAIIDLQPRHNIAHTSRAVG